MLCTQMRDKKHIEKHVLTKSIKIYSFWNEDVLLIKGPNQPEPFVRSSAMYLYDDSAICQNIRIGYSLFYSIEWWIPYAMIQPDANADLSWLIHRRNLKYRRIITPTSPTIVRFAWILSFLFCFTQHAAYPKNSAVVMQLAYVTKTMHQSRRAVVLVHIQKVIQAINRTKATKGIKRKRNATKKQSKFSMAIVHCVAESSAL